MVPKKRDPKKQSDSEAAPPASAPELTEDMLLQLAQQEQATQETKVHAEPKVVEDVPAIEQQEVHPVPPKSVDLEAIPEVSPDALDDAETDAAVDDILKEESDTTLAVDDAVAEADNQEALDRHKPHRVRKFFIWFVFLLILGAIGVFIAMPTYRYKVLNRLGVRSSLSLTVIDQSSQTPLAGVQVTLGTIRGVTDSKGFVRLTRLPLGKADLHISHIAFATIDQNIVVGWGSNPLGNFTMQPTGAQYSILVKGYVDGLSIPGAQANSNSAVFNADSSGKIVITSSGSPGASPIPVDITAPGFRTEHITLDPNMTTVRKIAMVPAVKIFFMTNDAGKFNLNAMYVDGQSKSTLLPGTGTEDGNNSLLVNISGNRVALVSTRDSSQDSSGNRQVALSIVNDDGTATIIDHAEHIQLIRWIGNTIVFEETTNGTGSSKYHLASFDTDTTKRYELASAQKFNTVQEAKGLVYYAISSVDPTAQAYFFSVNPDGSNKQTVLASEVWSSYRTSYGALALQTPDSWYAYTFGSGTPQKIAQLPSADSRNYIDNGAGLSVWAGQGGLTVYDIKNNSSTTLVSADGIGYPIRWLTADSIVYTVSNGSNVSEYIVAVNGGSPKKITDTIPTY